MSGPGPGFDDAPPPGGVASAADPPLPAGTAVGRYIVERALGAGAMGAVYAAIDPELDRRLALKLLRPGAAASPDARARMQREAQALARVSDPGVIAVHDVGGHGDRLFIAMELVEGTTLTGWLGARPRTWREIVATVAGAGRGLAAAHAAGLVHRDVKPDNILVDRHDRARIGDFGLAAGTVEAAADPGPGGATEPADPTERTAPDPSRARASASARDPDRPGLDEPLTRTGAVVGTPAYMAPEQMAGAAASVRSDQFSFCVTLYEALYGVRPYRGESVPAIRDAMRAAAPPPPTDRGVPARIRAALARGLSIDPAARHPSMAALLAQLDPAPRARRWVIAAAGAVGVAAIATFALVAADGNAPAPCGGGVAELATVWNPARATAIRTAFADAGAGAAVAPADAEHVIAELDRRGAAWVAGQRRACEDTRVHHRVDDAALALRIDCYASHRRRLGATVDALARADAEVARRALDAVAALPSLAACDDVAGLRQVVPPPSDPARRDRATALAAELERLEVRIAAEGPTAGLHAELATAVATARELDHPPLLALALYLRAGVGDYLGDEEAAATELREAVAAADRGGDDRTRFAALALLITVLGEFHAEEALPLIPQAEAALARVGDDPDLERRWLVSRAAAYLDAGDPRRAAELYQEVVRRLIAAEGIDAASLADPTMNLAFALTWYAAPTEALVTVRRAISLYTTHWGAGHPKTLNARGQEAVVLEQAGRPAEGLAIMEDVVEREIAIFGGDSPRVALDLVMLGGLSRLVNRYDDAVRYYQRALAIRAAVVGPDHPLIAEIKIGLAQCAVEQHDPKTALPLVDEAARIISTTMGADDAYMATVHYVRGMALREAGDSAAALVDFERGYAIERAVAGDDAPQLAEALDFIGGTLVDLGRADEALPTLERAAAMREGIDGDPGDLAGIWFDLARAHAAVGHRDRARYLVALALPIMVSTAIPSDYRAAQALAARLGM